MKRSKHLEPLSHDHFEGLLVAGRLRTGLDNKVSPEIMAAYAVHVRDNHLENHFRQEENVLLPLMDTPPTAALAERMVREHRRIYELVTDVETAPDDSAQALAELADLLKAHIRFEERELFPALEDVLSEDILVEAGRRLRNGHVETDLTWTPAFWE